MAQSVEIVPQRSPTPLPPVRRAPPAGVGPRPGRVAYLDNLKLLLVAVIIAGHGALAYGSLESAWPYQDIQEVQLGAVSDVVLALLVIPAALFAMGLFFLISGLVTYRSLARKGPRVFARDRLVRLGVPLVVWTLLLWPGAIWISHRAAGQEQSFCWATPSSHTDSGPTARRRRPPRRSAYAAFLLQGVVLIALMVAMRPVDVPAEIKALTVAGFGVAGSFALAWLLVSRTRLGRVL